MRVFGTPAEEKGTGKEIMVNRGVFDDTHAAMMVHPTLKDVVIPQLRASRSWQVTYAGRGGHASRPWSSLNAGDAAVVAQTAIGLLRQQLRDGSRVHHVVKEAGTAVNVIPDHAVIECMIRCDTIAEVDEVWDRVRRCFDAGAVATGTSVEYTTLPSIYREFRHDPDLASRQKMVATPPPSASSPEAPKVTGSYTTPALPWPAPSPTPPSPGRPEHD